MNFFEHQDQARSSTRKLVVLFACAVFTLALVTSFLIYGLVFYAESGGVEGLDISVTYSEVFISVFFGVIAVVILGSLFRMAQLKGGGRVVAESMNGRLLNTSTRDADERKVLNIVEEMAIASGLPVPPVYLMEDAGINAFAAGYHQKDAVIGVTRGCIQQLSRDELQGVIAHEFSHIFHGDMKINIRLMGVLYGIMVLGMIGYFLMRGSIYTVRRNRNNGIIFLGLGLVVIGYGGTFFGNLIKAAVSRQREFLADASAVQFTRNPDGIAGALKKIGGFKEGSQIKSVDVSEISHMLFEEGLSTGFTSLFATHPPLQERIKRIDPRFNGKFDKGESTDGKPQSADSSRASAFSGENVSAFSGSASAPGASGINTSGASSTSDSIIDSVGNPQSEHMALARQLLSDLPPLLVEAGHEPFGARSIVHALVIFESEQSVIEKQLQHLQKEFSRAEFSLFANVFSLVRELDRTNYLPLLELSIPSLKQLSEKQYQVFMGRLSKMIVADDHVSLFEWSLFTILRYNLEESERYASGSDLNMLPRECSVLLSALAFAGQASSDKAAIAFNAGEEELGLASHLKFINSSQLDIKALDNATSKLKQIKPLQKPRLLKALVRCIEADGVIKPEEGELIRAIASLLDCPLPPFVMV